MYYYFEKNPELIDLKILKIIGYESRFEENTKKFIPASDESFRRRKQVVTLQNDVLEDLPKEIKELIDQNSEEIWRNSRNIPIYLFEDVLYEFITREILNKEQPQNFQLEIRNEKFELNNLNLEKKGFNVLMNCEGSSSGIKKHFNMKNVNVAKDQGLGIFFVQDLTLEQLAQNSVLTVCQSRYLINSSSKKGFINIRLFCIASNSLNSFRVKRIRSDTK